MSSYALEILADCHARAEFASGLESVDRYLRETARSHLEKGVSVSRVLVAADALPPKAVLGYFTLSNITVEAREWPGVPKTLPRQSVSAVLLGRLAVAKAAHGRGIGSMLVAAARQLARETIARTGGVGLVFALIGGLRTTRQHRSRPRSTKKTRPLHPGRRRRRRRSKKSFVRSS
ncbi:MAG: GNAT family N-acetyltransferase [Verrucomicrobia bacterium]|nr:GNAT family N-acetyltransferase [Verrucomicrobiota bacterium]